MSSPAYSKKSMIGRYGYAPSRMVGLDDGLFSNKDKTLTCIEIVWRSIEKCIFARMNEKRDHSEVVSFIYCEALSYLVSITCLAISLSGSISRSFWAYCLAVSLLSWITK